jgi:peptidoglycan-N-acetylglucosamine deacetylase
VRRRLCAISVDLDETPNYFKIHGLPLPERGSRAAHAVYDASLSRLDAFAGAHGLPLTLFAIGRDLDRPESASALRRLCDRGHAAENHSLDHRYDLTRLDAPGIEREIVEGARAIERATGRRPTGFRAPGYTVNDAVFDALDAASVAFDSSVFPCPAYYSAKALVLGLMGARGRRSDAVLDSPRVMFAPSRPYRPGRPWYRRGSRGFIELPIQVTPRLRLPMIGTSIGMAGPTGARLLAAMCSGEALVNIELHGMDVLDVSDGLAALAPHQPELRTPLARRLDSLSAVVERLARDGYAFVRLDEAAEEIRKHL